MARRKTIAKGGRRILQVDKKGRHLGAPEDALYRIDLRLDAETGGRVRQIAINERMPIVMMVRRMVYKYLDDLDAME